MWMSSCLKSQAVHHPRHKKAQGEVVDKLKNLRHLSSGLASEPGARSKKELCNTKVGLL